MGRKMRTNARIGHAVARGECCLMGQILLILGGPTLLGFGVRARRRLRGR
jgi:hypothetical protein